MTISSQFIQNLLIKQYYDKRNQKQSLVNVSELLGWTFSLAFFLNPAKCAINPAQSLKWIGTKISLNPTISSSESSTQSRNFYARHSNSVFTKKLVYPQTWNFFPDPRECKLLRKERIKNSTNFLSRQKRGQFFICSVSHSSIS